MKAILAITFLGFGILTFTESNNLSEFNPPNSPTSLNLDTVTKQQFDEFMKTHIIEDLLKCCKAANPKFGLSKCPSGIRYSFSSQAHTKYLYKKYPIQGVIYMYSCSSKAGNICEFKAVYDTKTIELKADYFSDWVPKKQFVNSFCKKAKSDPKLKEGY